jgi:hypothetical protein
MRRPTTQQALAAVFIAFFCAVLVLPGLLIGRGEPWNSNAEGHNPAEFPQLHTAEGSLNPKLKEGFEMWFNDHLGLRNGYIRLKANVYVGLLGKSTSERVYLGKDGWYFYTEDRNIELATGEYPLGEAELDAIARNQQAIHDWYESQGVDYILLLTPSKVTIYPEYLYGGYTVGQSPIDIVTTYLEEHTDVTVVNTKPAILAAKDGGRLVYWKSDTHWNANGSYAAYESLLKRMNQEGILAEESPVPAFDEGLTENALGDWADELKRMLGDRNLLDSRDEKVSVLTINQRARPLSQDSASFKEISEVAGNRFNALEVYGNPDKDKTLLLYGDSFFRSVRKFPVFMAEHYGQLVYTGIIPTINLPLEKLVAPDTVVFTCTERYLVPRLTNPQNIPLIVDDPVFLGLPVKQATPDKDLYYGGLVFEKLDGEKLTDDIPPMPTEKASYHTIEGWALDVDAGLPLEALYLKVGDTYFQCNYGNSRPDVAEHFDNEALTNVGYHVTIPSELLKEGDTIAFIAIGADGTYRLPERPFTTVQSTGSP